MLNYNKCEKKAGKLRQESLPLYQLHRPGNKECIKSYECLNKVKDLTTFIVVAITKEKTCDIMDCKDKDRDRSKHCWWDSALRGE